MVEVTPPEEDINIGELLHIGFFLPVMSNDSTVPSQSSDNVLDEEQIARNVQALKNRLRGRGGPPGRRGRGRADVGNGRDSLPGSEYVVFIRHRSNVPILTVVLQLRDSV